MKAWDTQDAKAKLSLLLREAEDTPQEICRHGKPVAVVISIKSYNQLVKPKNRIQTKPDLVDFFQNSPLKGLSLKTERLKSGVRDIDL
ncbi:MAG TPA: type II toxin-antitoxin system Phd/YefM family antitoxin [Coxiellaceae bacterium]|nr:type II toxin-antitoxin system Phd/YefM family antitoxin [Coxiellaceae bacterium]